MNTIRCTDSTVKFPVHSNPTVYMLTRAFVVTLLQTVKFNGICILIVILTCLECILCRGKLKLLHVHVFTMFSADFFVDVDTDDFF